MAEYKVLNMETVDFKVNKNEKKNIWQQKLSHQWFFKIHYFHIEHPVVVVAKVVDDVDERSWKPLF